VRASGSPGSGQALPAGVKYANQIIWFRMD
jgi:hypothetical protein